VLQIDNTKWVRLTTEQSLKEEFTLLHHHYCQTEWRVRERTESWHCKLKVLYDLWTHRFNYGGTLVKTALLQDSEAAPILKLSGIPIKEGRSSGSRRFIVEKDRRRKSRRGKREKQTTQGHRDRGEGKTSSKREERYTKFKNSFMKTRNREEWDRGREDGWRLRVDGHAWKQQKSWKEKRETSPQGSRLHVQIFNCWSKQLHIHKHTHPCMHAEPDTLRAGLF